jgi:hypothetical protein
LLRGACIGITAKVGCGHEGNIRPDRQHHGISFRARFAVKNNAKRHLHWVFSLFQFFENPFAFKSRFCRTDKSTLVEPPN